MAALLITAVFLVASAAILNASDNYTVNAGTSQTITAHGFCAKVTNNSATNASVYVPTQTAVEWESFRTMPPQGVSLDSCVTPGSTTYSTPGTYTFTVPAHNSLTVRLWGGGGGGHGLSPNINNVGFSGATSSWDGGYSGRRPTASGGDGRQKFRVSPFEMSGGTGYYCDTKGTGGTAYGNIGSGGKGAGGGGAGGAQGVNRNGYPGVAPGGGGGGTIRGSTWSYGGGGGGGYCLKKYTAGTYAPGAKITIVVGAGGAGGNGSHYDGGNGAPGRTVITWD